MATYTQSNRPLRVLTPLGDDALLLVGLSGYEAISQLFSFSLELLAEEREKIVFEKVLGQPVIITIVLPDNTERYFHGMCSRFSVGAQEGDDENFSTFTNYRMEVVPLLWLLTKRAQSRIFQHITVPDILKKCLAGIPVSFELNGTFEPRDYCVQYRETDFNFVSRLMEEEGIFYFFKHTQKGHQLVIANTPQSIGDLPYSSSIIYESIAGGNRPDDRIFDWEKTQEIRSGKYTLWDHSFELPHKHLDASQPIQETVTAGTINHKFSVGNSSSLEIYDYPGGYAQRFDGIAAGGGEQPAELQKIFSDNKRTAKIRIQQEAVNGLTVVGASNCRHFASGKKFDLEHHFDGNGAYVLTSVTHSAWVRGYRTTGDEEFGYQNTFTCIPAALPFRPVRMTSRPTVLGTQTALVVGPPGEEIFTDKYGRVKVQFHWDREGKTDQDSSCWIRVAHDAAGKHWGSFYIPRIGHEVVIAFEEGDPDRPIIVGSVYNENELPPYDLPNEKAKSVLFKSNTYKGKGFNEIRVDDTKGKEQIFIHGQHNRDIRIRNDQMETIGNESHLIIGKDQLELVKGDKHQLVKGDLNEKIEGTVSLTVKEDQLEKVDRRYALETGSEIHLKAGTNVIIEGGTMITLKVAGNFVTVGPAGVAISGTMVNINSGGAAGSGSGAQPETPKDAREADTAKQGEASKKAEPSTPPKPFTISPGALVMKQAANSGAPFCEI